MHITDNWLFGKLHLDIINRFNGVDMNASGLSKLEGQIRYVTDVELVALADILEVSVDYLLGRDTKK